MWWAILLTWALVTGRAPKVSVVPPQKGLPQNHSVRHDENMPHDMHDDNTSSWLAAFGIRLAEGEEPDND